MKLDIHFSQTPSLVPLYMGGGMLVVNRWVQLISLVRVSFVPQRQVEMDGYDNYT